MDGVEVDPRRVVVELVAIPEVALNRVLLRNIDVVGAYYGGWLGGHPEARGEIGRRFTA